MKFCRACNTNKNISEYHKCSTCSDGLGLKCKMCTNSGILIVNREYVDGLLKCKSCSIAKENEFFYMRTEGTYDSTCKECRKLSDPEKILKRKEYIRDYVRRRRENDPLFKLQGNLKSLIKSYIKRLIDGRVKKSKTHEILGCTAIEFKSHIESQFLPWMSWENYGKYNGELEFGWDLDHIIPLTCFCEEELIIKFNHWSNFQPLCSKVNRDEKINSLFPLTNLELQITIEICQ